MSELSGFRKYYRQYHIRNVTAMLKNNGAEPLRCATPFGKNLVMITGATSGIGYAAARKYASMGADLICINRNREKSERLCREIEETYRAECSFLITDFSEMTQVRKLAEDLATLRRPLDVCIYNAGVYLTKKTETGDGLETVFVVNHLSSFLLTATLVPILKRQGHGRILFVNSEGHRFAAWGLRTDDLNWNKRRYWGLGSYGSAKLAQLLTMLIFAEELDGSGATINAMHPGAVKTEAGKDNGRFYKWYKNKILERNFRTSEISAEALYYLGVSDEVAHVNGKFFNLTCLEDPAPPAVDREAAEAIFRISSELCGVGQRG